MEIAKRSQFCELIGKLLVKTNDEKVSLIDKTKIQNVIDSLSSGDDVVDSLIKFINDGKLLPEIDSMESFIVGQVFQHGNKDLVPQWFGDNFKSWLWTSAQEKTISINVFGNNILKEYILPKNMNDTAIKNASKSSSMTENQFWVMLYLLIINPKLGKRILKYELRKDKVYICHVKLSSGVSVAVDLYWFDDEWRLYAYDFDYGNDWYGGCVFLFPATK